MSSGRKRKTTRSNNVEAEIGLPPPPSEGEAIVREDVEPIIPGLQHDVALRCLAKIPHGYHGTLETVSKRWRDVLHSTEYSNYKAKEGWSGDWVFLLIQNSNHQWIAYDPDADRWHPIPMIPGWEEYVWSVGFGCVCVGHRFLVIGGAHCRTNLGLMESRKKPIITNQVFQFDTFTKQWSEAASMRTPRAYFGCCVMSGKVYVCGGRNMSHLGGFALVEVYDPLTNKWEELPPMRNNQMDSLSFHHDRKLYVFNDKRPRNYTPMCEYRTETFDPSKRVWRTEQMNWPCSNFGLARIQVTEDGRMYALVHVDGEENIVKTMDNGGEWHAVAQLPSIVGPPPDGDLSDMEDFGTSCNGFVALGNELYVMGGLKSSHELDERLMRIILELDRCWIWDGKWRETRPLCRPSGGVVKGFAALKEKKMFTT